MKQIAAAFIVVFASVIRTEAGNCTFADKPDMWRIAGCEIGRGQVETTTQTDAWDMLMALDEIGAVAVIDWELATEDVLWHFDKMLDFAGLPVFSPDERKRLTETGKATPNDSVPMARLEADLDRTVSAHGGELLYINTDSDSYVYAVVSECMYRRWSNVSWGNGFVSIPINRDAMRKDFRADIKSDLPREECGTNQ